MLTLLTAWLPNAGAAGVAILVMYVFLNHNKYQQKELVTSFRDELKSIRDEHRENGLARNAAFKEDIDETRSFFKEELREQRSTFTGQLSAITTEFHGFQEEVTDSLKELRDAFLSFKKS